MDESEHQARNGADPRVRAILMALVDIDPQFDEEFNDWYDNVHVPELVACPGFLSGRRGVAADPSQSPRYVAIYELEDENALESQAVQGVRGWGPFSDRVRNYRRLLFTPTGKPIVSPAEKGASQ
ncbi:MAG TPA: hypothetical protein VJT84_11770 [Gaiellaceae bacterium]|nr:hypothetical protein [Gaiellaceae bacterium]